MATLVRSKMGAPLARRRRAMMSKIRSREYQQRDIQIRWNWLPVARRQELYYRFADRLERLFESLGLTGQCTVCGAIMPAGQFTHRHPCPECGRHEVATPYGS